MQYLALQYTIEHQDRSDAECLNVTIGNIPIVNASNGNQIILYFLERNAANQNRMTRAAVIFTDHEEEESLEVEYADLEKTSN
jgi:type I site-specific restriction endonuclease